MTADCKLARSLFTVSASTPRSCGLRQRGELLVMFGRLAGAASTVGVNKNWTLVFVNFSAQDASILKISVPIRKRRS